MSSHKDLIANELNIKTEIVIPAIHLIHQYADTQFYFDSEVMITYS
jgi:hypothetical protein